MALLIYWPVAIALLGFAAFLAARDLPFETINRDIWQHVAALQALTADLSDPANPFVASEETSRHFHPLWVGLAWLAQMLALDAWQALVLASYASMAFFAVAVFAFARAAFGSPWAPLVLLLVLTLGWLVPPQHTGFHSFATFAFGAMYPASFLIGMSLLLWALTIWALDRPALVFCVVVLAALMMATHPLGAVIGFIGAGAFSAFWPRGRRVTRGAICLALVAGCGLATFWPYYNVFALIRAPGASDWQSGQDLSDPVALAWLAVPAVFGLWGLRGPQGRPLAAALAAYGVACGLGLAGIQIGNRFLMPLLLCLQIGLAFVILARLESARSHWLNIGVLAALACFSLWLAADQRFRDSAGDREALAAAQILTRDIPDSQEVAAFGLTAWPVVATGQRVHAIPWPEPGIGDLAARQAAIVTLFDPALPDDRRRELAQALGLSVLLVDARLLPEADLAPLLQHADRVRQEGTLWRIDLID